MSECKLHHIPQKKKRQNKKTKKKKKEKQSMDLSSWHSLSPKKSMIETVSCTHVPDDTAKRSCKYLEGREKNPLKKTGTTGMIGWNYLILILFEAMEHKQFLLPVPNMFCGNCFSKLHNAFFFHQSAAAVRIWHKGLSGEDEGTQGALQLSPICQDTELLTRFLHLLTAYKSSSFST